MTKNQSRSSWKVIVVGSVIFIILIGVFVKINAWINQEVDQAKNWTDQSLRVEPAVLKESSGPKKSIKIYSNVIRRTWIEPNRQFYESVFFSDEQEIGRYKSVTDEIFDVKGVIPDGKVTFFNQTDETQGEEQFFNGQRNGWFREYYSNDQLKKETHYDNGKPKLNKEYYFDGTKKMEQDLTDAMWITDNSEVGIGKVYHRSGILRYEWNLTNSSNGGYNRSYNIEGTLTQENIFDQNGELITTRNF